MAVTRTIPLPLVGPSAKAGIAAQQSGRTVNFMIEMGGVDARAPIALRHAHGYFRWANAAEPIPAIPADAPMRGKHTMGSRAFVAVHNYVLEVFANNSFVVLATLSTFSGPVGFSDNAGKLVIGDGAFWTYDFNFSALRPVLNDGEEQLRGYWSRWIDGTTLYFQRNSETYSYSAIDDPTTVLGLAFMGAEGNPDNILNAWVLNRQIIVIGENSTEWHWDSGEADSPFRRMEAGFVEHGCVGMRASCPFDNTVVMVGKNDAGAGRVLRLTGAGAAPGVISSPAVEQCITKVLFGGPNLARKITMFPFDDAGHSMFYINLPPVPATVNSPAQPSMTWVYDAAVPPEYAWTERARTNPETGQFERILSDDHFFWRGRHYTIGYNAPHIYEQSLDYYRENTGALVKRREVGPMTFGGQRFELKALELFGETGVGRDGGVQGSDPLVMVQLCWDGRWGDEIHRHWGKIGERNARALLTKCGSGRELVIRVSCSEPIPFDLTGAVATVAR